MQIINIQRSFYAGRLESLNDSSCNVHQVDIGNFSVTQAPDYDLISCGVRIEIDPFGSGSIDSGNHE